MRKSLKQILIGSAVAIGVYVVVKYIKNHTDVLFIHEDDDWECPDGCPCDCDSCDIYECSFCVGAGED